MTQPILSRLSAQSLDELKQAATPEEWEMIKKGLAQFLEIPFCPHSPEDNPKQVQFLLDFSREALYGGAAGGGKSDALLMAALQFIHVPGYAAILIRKTFTDLKQPKALIDRSHQWFGPHPEVRWDPSTHTWTFPSGATLGFGYMEAANDKYRYASAEFQFIGFDEVTQFDEHDYRFMFTRLRRPGGLAQDDPLAHVPLRMRCATNPIGVGRGWVKRRFPVDGKPRDKKRTFIPATIYDNKHLDTQEYIESLNELDPITRKQMLNGDWSELGGGRFLARGWWGWLPERPPLKIAIRYWDLAASTDKDADYTAGVLMGRAVGGEMRVKGGSVFVPPNAFIIANVVRGRWSAGEVESRVKSQAAIDGKGVAVYIEQDPAQAGKSQIDYYRRNVLVGYTFHGHRFGGDKEVRAGPFASQVEGHNVYLIEDQPWTQDFLDECDAFPDGEHDDQVDASSGAFDVLVNRESGMNVITFPISMERGASPWAV